MRRGRARKLALVAALLSLSLIFSYLETILPSFLPNPAFKVGLSQIPVLLGFYLYDLKTAGFVSFSKVLLMSLILGFFLNFLFFVNLAGALASLLALFVSSRMRLSIYSVSVCASLGHNLGQFLVIGASLGMGVALFYLPFILLFSVLFGLLVGIVSKLVLDRLPKGLA